MKQEMLNIAYRYVGISQAKANFSFSTATRCLLCSVAPLLHIVSNVLKTNKMSFLSYSVLIILFSINDLHFNLSYLTVCLLTVDWPLDIIYRSSSRYNTHHLFRNRTRSLPGLYRCYTALLHNVN